MNNIEFINDAYTEDGLKLPMVHFESKEKDVCVICIHGMCGTIIDNYFATVWGKILSENNIDLQPRFDVVEVTTFKNKESQIIHFENAFDIGECDEIF